MGAMDDKIRVTWQDLSVGRKLPWNVYNSSGKLLLSAGHIITSDHILESMRKYVLYRDPDTSEYGNASPVQGGINPFGEMQNYANRLNSIFASIEAGNKMASARLSRLVNDIMVMCDKSPDAAIANVHLPNSIAYSTFHSIQCAIICCLIGTYIEMPKKELQMLCGAALVANVSMRKLQDILFAQGGKADKTQQAMIHRHPQRSMEMIKAIGIENKLCQDIVLMHHERTNGKGYPTGLFKKQIIKGALILAVADRYGAMVTMRDYREPVPVKDSLKSFLLGEGKEYDEEYSLLLIKVMTVFPPGSFVRLKNGETAIVIKRGKANPMHPIVKSLEGADGQRYTSPLLRDCSMMNYQITGVCDYDKNKPLNLNKIWDYI